MFRLDKLDGNMWVLSILVFFSYMFCSLCFLLSLWATAGVRTLSVFECKYNFSCKWVEIWSTALSWTIFQQIFEQSHREGEKYLTLFYWSSLYGDEVATVTVTALYSLLCTLSLSPCSVSHCHSCSFSLWTSRGKAKALDVDSWGADSTEAQEPLVGVCVCMCFYGRVSVYICDRAYAWLGVVQQQKNGCGQLILLWAGQAGCQPFHVKIGTSEIWVFSCCWKMRLIIHIQKYIHSFFMYESKHRLSFWLLVRLTAE